MKTYICDWCKEPLNDPHGVNMKEFTYIPDYEGGIVTRRGFKHKVKIHLCEHCYENIQKAFKVMTNEKTN